MKTGIPGRRGFTLIEIMIVVAVIGLLAAIAIPNFIHARKKAQTNSCINNLRQLDDAKQQWALETGKKSGDTPVDTDIKPYVGRGDGSLLNVHCPLVLPAAPLAGYTVNPVSTPPECGNYDPVQHAATLD